MRNNYPCDGADGYCPYAEYDNAESMWFCYNHCGVGACDEDDYPEEYYESEDDE